MKVQCGHCPAKYAVADERLRDKKVRIRCRRCNAAIVVDGKVNPPLVTSTPARPSAGPGTHVLGPESFPPSSPPPDHPRPVAHTIMGGLQAPATHQLMQAHVGRATPDRAAEDRFEGLYDGKPDSSRGFTDPPARGDADRWRVALTQQDLRWMTTEEITQAFKDGAVKSETFVFRAGMPSWVTLMEVSEIAQALADAHLVSPPLQGLRLDEQALAGPPLRNSSLPPPRKAARQASSPLAELLAATADGASEPEESMPFALVAERGSKRPEERPAPEAAAPEATTLEAGVLEAREPEAAGLEARVPEATASNIFDPPRSPADGGAPAVAGPQPAASEAPSVAVLGSGGAFETEAAVPQTAQKSSSAWVWISLAILLLLAGAVWFLGPRFGLRLR